MTVRSLRLLARPTTTLGRVVGCLSVSVGTTVLSAAILVVLAVGMGVPAGTANVVAVVCGIAPSYFANRRWVWGREGRGSVAREAVPFWTMCIVGLVASTVAVDRVGSLTAAWSGAARAVALPAVNAAVFGALWVMQFLVLDRVIFRTRRNPSATTCQFSRSLDRVA